MVYQFYIGKTQNQQFFHVPFKENTELGFYAQVYLEPAEHLQYSFFAKIVNGLQLLTIFAKKLIVVVKIL